MPQQPLQIGDRVEVGFATNIPSEQRAVFHPDNLKKVGGTP